MEHHMIMFFILAAVHMKMTGSISDRVCIDMIGTGHAQMGNQHCLVIEPDEQIFRPSLQVGDAPAFNTLDEFFREWKAQIRAAHFQALDTGTLHCRLKATTNGFDFWQFGHAALGSFGF